jgi:hypothetical protein
MLITPQIVNLKMIECVFVHRKRYQCGGETLGTVVKHSVRDSNIAFLQLRILEPFPPGTAHWHA